jgi:uncharacterized protein (TIGR02421 family)
MDIQKIQRIDSTIYDSAKKFQILKHLNWPPEEEVKFLSAWRRGNPTLPALKLQTPDMDSQILDLDKLVDECTQEDPVEKFLAETALSYANAGRMLKAVGTKDFTHYSEIIYGRPDDGYKNQKLTAIDSANFFLDLTDELLGGCFIPPATFDITSTDFADWMRTGVEDFFIDDIVDVVIDDSISAKALAGSKRIKISEAALFSSLDKDQLLNHEAFIHTATMLNGKKQENLKCLGLGAPRTTRTQEGLAVTAELATRSMDIVRLRRIALRVLAVQMALDGADFIELFKFFVSRGQTEEDAVRSTQRIFRGGDVKGGVVFTKDAVYLQGLLEINTYMRVAIRHNRPELIQNLFAGRLTMGDAIRLAPVFQNGWLRPPTYVPEWASDFRKLAAHIAYSIFVGNIHLEKVSLNRFVDFEETLKLR